MNLVEVNHLNYRYDPRKTDGIQDLNFNVKKGEIFSLVGPSGSGKTTTLKCLASIIPREDNTIVFSEETKISIIDQNAKLNEENTVYQNLKNEIAYITDEDKQNNQIITTLSLLELTNEIESPTKNLSAGQRQRLILAMALVTNPTLILLDEPFANLDKNLREILLTELWELFKSKQITVIWVTHDTEEALKYSDRIMLLNFGEIQQIGSPRELFFKPKNYFVANFFGENNILPCKKSAKETYEVLGKSFSLTQQVPEEDEFLIVLRPQFISIKPKSEIKVKVAHIYFMGSKLLLKTTYKDIDLYIEVDSSEEYKLNQNLFIDFNANKISILEVE